ncbi:MAG: hypothetical protein AAGC71_01310 [Pseudomonadota bacterium]
MVPMPDAVWLLIAFIAAVVIYTGMRLRRLQKQSEEQWKRVDHSKLREWQDDD